MNNTHLEAVLSRVITHLGEPFLAIYVDTHTMGTSKGARTGVE